MEFKKLDDPKRWDKFCLENNEAWFFRTSHWLEYLMNSKVGTKFINHSFTAERNGKIIDIVPLLQEGTELFSPGFNDEKETIQEIKRIAVENDIKRIQVNSSVKEYLNISGYTCLLDLNNVRPTKGHDAAIKKAKKYLTYKDISNIDKFREYYYIIAGKITRPRRTFELLEQWIRLGYGTLLEAQYEKETAGYVYILHWKNGAYYFMSCLVPKFTHYNVTHFLLWQAFKLLRKKGIKYIELGEQVANSLYSQPTEKEKNISKFKKRFGGQIIISPASEYYFCKEQFKQTMEERISKYIESEYG